MSRHVMCTVMWGLAFAPACSGAGGAGDSTAAVGPPQFGGAESGGSAAPSGVTAPLAPAQPGFFDEEPASVGATDDCGPNLTGVLRDFRASHPDFGDAIADDRGIVRPMLGPDRKPSYASPTPTPTTSGAANFDQWYRDTPGVNQSVPFTLTLEAGAGGVSTFEDAEFFPLDEQLYGNEDQEHNFHFTFELHTEFAYRGGEVFTFAGDDDLWVFINDRLAIDLGGVHPAQTDTVDLDAESLELGIEVGGSYRLDLFHAERHASGSHFRVDTSLRFTSCGTIILR